jgi:hypothetical protein
MIWDMVAEFPDGPLCPGPIGSPYMPYNTAYSRLVSLTKHLGRPLTRSLRSGGPTAD